MSHLFTIFIMWVLYQNSLCSYKLTLWYTIIVGIFCVLGGIKKAVEECQARKAKEQKEFEERMAQYKFDK